MARKRRASKRELLPDPKYHSVLVTKFVSNLMKDGKKSVAECIFYSALDTVAERTDQDGLERFQKALDNIKPAVEVRSRRVGGSTYQIPVEVRPERRLALAIRWLIQYAAARNERTMADRLAGEIMAAVNNEGAAMRRKDETHRMAEANRAFSHYRLS